MGSVFFSVPLVLEPVVGENPLPWDTGKDSMLLSIISVLGTCKSYLHDIICVTLKLVKRVYLCCKLLKRIYWCCCPKNLHSLHCNYCLPQSSITTNMVINLHYNGLGMHSLATVSYSAMLWEVDHAAMIHSLFVNKRQ